MSSIKKTLIALSVVVIVSAFVPAVKAQDAGEANWPTRISFTLPVQVGDMVLTPGSYEFMLTPGTWARNVVAIYSVDQGRWLGMVMGINVSRVDTAKMTGFTFADMGMGAPKALQYWFHSDWSRGVKFLYSHTSNSDTMAAANIPFAR